jgi:NAD-dependent DNA ligase
MFVLTGDFDLGKKYWQNYILKRGGIVKSSVNHNVKYLVKENGKLDGTRSVKEVEARNLNIPIIDIDTLRKMR